MAWRKAVLKSDEAAHLHSYSRNKTNPDIKTGYFGRIGKKLKTGDLLDVDYQYSANDSSNRRWVYGKYKGTTGFIRQWKVFPFLFSSKIDNYETWSKEVGLNHEKEAQRILFLDKTKTFYGNYQSLGYFKDVFGGFGRSFAKQVLDKGWLDPAFKAELTEGRKQWRASAISKLKSFQQKTTAYNAYDLLSLEGFDELSTLNAQFKKLFSVSKGFFIGESHNDSLIKKFLINQFPALKADGVDTMYIEHFQYNILQTLFDNFRDADTVNDIPDHLKKLLKSWDSAYLDGKKPTENLSGVINKAKENGIRVVLIDHQYSFLNKRAGDWDPKTRVLLMNFISEKIIQENPSSKKWIGLIGKAHAFTHEGGIPGLCQLLAVPGVVINPEASKLILIKDNIAHRSERHSFT